MEDEEGGEEDEEGTKGEGEEVHLELCEPEYLSDEMVRCGCSGDGGGDGGGCGGGSSEGGNDVVEHCRGEDSAGRWG